MLQQEKGSILLDLRKLSRFDAASLALETGKLGRAIRERRP
jgi:hypothetical protein